MTIRPVISLRFREVHSVSLNVTLTAGLVDMSEVDVKTKTKQSPPKHKRLTWLGKLRRAWATPTKWYPIPIGLGALVLLAVEYRHMKSDPEVISQREGGAVVKPSGPWQVRISRSWYWSCD